MKLDLDQRHPDANQNSGVCYYWCVEYIVFVNENGQPTGQVGEKLASHNSATKLHLAFSCYIFNNDGKVLVTRRADNKKVWPSVWTNSVCGHPSPGETFENAIQRRSTHELGLAITDIKIRLPTYRYQTPLFNGVIENEFCPVFFARTGDEPNPNPDEVSTYEWITWDELVRRTNTNTQAVWSWWCKYQVPKLHNLLL